MKKTILVDCDGVVLNWEYAFDVFMEEHGFTRVEDANKIYNIGARYGIDKDQGKKLIKMFNESIPSTKNNISCPDISYQPDIIF